MKNKKSKDAEYIELDKSEYKNKNSIYWLITFIITFALIIFYLLKDGKFINDLKNAFFINNQKKSYEIVELDSAPEYLTTSKVMDLFQERDFNYQILDKKNDDNKKKINSLELQINNLKKQFNNLIQQNDFDQSEESELISPNKAYLNLILLNKKLFSNEPINKELEFLESYFSENENITTLLKYFKSIERVPLNNFELIVELDSLAQKFNLINLDKSDEVFSNSNWQEAIKSKEGFKKNLMNFIDTNFKIRLIDQDVDLNDYTDINNNGRIEIVDSLMQTRSKLLLNDLKGAKINLEEISSPFPYEFEVILQKINELLIFNENIKKLEEEILISILNI